MQDEAKHARQRGRLIRLDVYLALREEILNCTLQPGAELREQELAARFEVSKSPVREALLRLEREGLIIVTPRQGYRVAPISLSEAKDMFELRLVLEEACAVSAIRDASDEVLAGLDEFRTFGGGPGPDGFIDYNSRFHAAIAACSGNAKMAELTCNLIEHMDRLVRMSLSVDSDHGPDHQRLVQEHALIIDTIQQRDRRRVRQLVRRHISAAQKRVMTALEWNLVKP